MRLWSIDPGHVLEQMKQVVVKELGMKPSKVATNSRLA
jgi:hypothetical protein